MPGRVALLRVLFASLALAAVCGALGILYADYDMIWRVVWTAVLTALASMLLLAATRHAEREQVRPAVTTAVALIVVDYVLIVLFTWQFLGEEFAGACGMSALWIALVGIPAVAFVRMLGKPQTRWAGRVGLVLAGIQLAVLLLMSWIGDDTFGSFELEGFAAALAPTGIAIVLCLIGLGTDRRHWRWLGVGAALAVLVIYTYNAQRSGNQWETALVYLACLAAAVAHANVIMMLPLRDNQLWLRHLTILAAVTTAAATGAAITLDDGGGSGDFIARLAGAAALVAGCGTVALAVLGRLNQRLLGAPAPPTIPDVRELLVQCPVCQRRQPIPVGGGRCAGCNLIIHVRIEEPRCPACGYSLLMLKADRCPECGAPLPPLPVGEGQGEGASAVVRLLNSHSPSP